MICKLRIVRHETGPGPLARLLSGAHKPWPRAHTCTCIPLAAALLALCGMSSATATEQEPDRAAVRAELRKRVDERQAGSPPTASGPIALKRQVEDYYAGKAGRLLAPSFRRAPVVAVEVQLDGETVERVVRGTADATETILRTPGAIRQKSVAVAVPADEWADVDTDTIRRLLLRGCDLAPEELEVFPLAYRPPAPVALPEAPRAPDPEAAWIGLVRAHAGNAVWAAVAIAVAFLGWSLARRALARPPAPRVPTPFYVPPGTVAPAPTAAPSGAAQPPAVIPPAPPARARDLLADLRSLVEADPARAADALRVWIGA